MGRRPVEANFYAVASEADIEVTFAPTRIIYSFSLSLVNLISPNAIIRHVGRRRDTGDYEPAEVQAMAYRVALATIKRLRLKSADVQVWPLQS
jgi:hypothetical protein